MIYYIAILWKKNKRLFCFLLGCVSVLFIYLTQGNNTSFWIVIYLFMAGIVLTLFQKRKVKRS